MLILRRVPRRTARASAALTTVESVTAMLVAHTVAGGALPGPGWLLPAAAAAYGASALVFSRRASMRVVLPLLVVLQLFLHAWVVTLSGHGHAAHAGDVLGLTGPMLAAHLAAGAVTALAWLLRRRAVDTLLTWLDNARLAVPRLRPGLGFGARVRPRSLRGWRLAPARGPPAGLVAAA